MVIRLVIFMNTAQEWCINCIIERASGLSYREYMEKEVLIPLGLNNTFVGRAEGGNVGAMESSWRNDFNGSQYSFDCC